MSEDWPKLGTQALPSGPRLLVLLISGAAAIGLAVLLNLGLLGAIGFAVVAIPLADFLYRRATG